VFWLGSGTMKRDKEIKNYLFKNLRGKTNNVLNNILIFRLKEAELTNEIPGLFLQRRLFKPTKLT